MDKANLLVERFFEIAPDTFGTGRALEFAVQMSLIVVEEILETGTKDREFWLKVKEELENK